jgi:hypothetical protein
MEKCQDVWRDFQSNSVPHIFVTVIIKEPKRKMGGMHLIWLDRSEWMKQCIFRCLHIPSEAVCLSIDIDGLWVLENTDDHNRIEVLPQPKRRLYSTKRSRCSAAGHSGVQPVCLKCFWKYEMSLKLLKGVFCNVESRLWIFGLLNKDLNKDTNFRIFP